jgi:hypothetical protein
VEKQIRKFRVYNTLMGFLHFVQGVVIICLSTNFKLPVNTSFLQFNSFTQTLDSATKNLFHVNLGYGVALFFFISALFHFAIATFYYRTYAANLEKGMNKARWYEYSISAALMIVLIGMLSGIYDLSSLMMMFGLTAVMNLCGLVMEVYNQKKSDVDWTAFSVGSLAGLLPWVAIAIYFWGAGTVEGNAIPTFVYWIFVSIFIFFFSFALNMYLQYQKVGPWKNYLFGEGMYILLSLVAKSLLAWQIFAGTLRPM